MTAPALVMLADGSEDSRVGQTYHLLRHKMQTLHEDLSVHLAFTQHCPPTGPQVVNTLTHRGVEEICFVPMNLTHAVDSPSNVSTLVANIRQTYPDTTIGLARPIGPASCLLNILDERLRDALEKTGSTELDGLVLALPDTSDTRGAGLLNRRARQWASHHKLPVQIGAGIGSTGVASAISALQAQGRRHIAVGSLHLVADQTYLAQASQALHHGAIAVSSPIGCDTRILDLVMTRYAYAAMDLLDFAEITESDDQNQQEAQQLAEASGN